MRCKVDHRIERINQGINTQTMFVSVWLLDDITLCFWCPGASSGRERRLEITRRAWDKHTPVSSFNWTVKEWSLCFCFLHEDGQEGCMLSRKFTQGNPIVFFLPTCASSCLHQRPPGQFCRNEITDIVGTVLHLEGLD